MNLYWPFLAPLIVVVAMTTATGVATMVRTALVLFIAYWVNSIFVLSTEIYDPWLFFIVSDAIAAAIVLYQPAGKVQAVIGGLLITQIFVHFLYGASKFFNPATVSIEAYLQILDVLGFLQLILLGVWAGGHWVGASHRTWRRWFARRAGSSGGKGVA